MGKGRESVFRRIPFLRNITPLLWVCTTAHNVELRPFIRKGFFKHE